MSCVYRLVGVCLGREKNSAVCRRRENKNAEGLNNKATELLVCPGGRGRYRGILSLKKKPLQSANGVTKDSVGKALLLSVNRELVLETCAAATRRRELALNKTSCVFWPWSHVMPPLLSPLFLSSLLSPHLMLSLLIHPVYRSFLIYYIMSILFLIIAQAHTQTSCFSPLELLSHPLSFHHVPWISEPVRAPAPQSALTPGVRGEDAVAAALRTSPPCLQSRGGKWH